MNSNTDGRQPVPPCVALIEQAFAERVLAQLYKLELLTDDDVVQILSQDQTGFGVWVGDPFHDKESEQFVARYIERSPLSLDKLSIQDDIVTYTTKDDAAHEFDTLEFLAALSAHILKTYESLTRYYGRYSCRRRGERAKLSPPLAEEQEREYRQEFRRSSWAACIKRVYEIDPLECPKCKAQMQIIAFIQDEHSKPHARVKHYASPPSFYPISSQSPQTPETLFQLITGSQLLKKN